VKLKVLVVTALFVAGLTASLALAAPSKKGVEAQTTTTSTTSDPKKPKCEQAELKGTATGSTFGLTVTKANKRGRDRVGTSVNLVIPAGASVKAKVCTTGGGLTLRDLHVKVKPPKP
jgi:hypothetical protein